MIQFLCPGCQQSFTVDNSRANTIGTCPKCRSRFYVPESPDAPSPSPPMPQVPKPVEPVTLKRHRYEDDEPRRNSRKRTDDWDDEEEDDEPIRKSKRPRKKKKSLSLFEEGNSFSVFLMGYVGVSVLLILCSLAVPAVIFVPLVLAWFVSMGASLWMLILTFQDSVEAGLLTLFLPFYALFYLVNNFDYVKKPFYLYLITLPMILISAVILAMQSNGVK